MNRRFMLCLTTVGVISFCASGVARADEVLKFRLIAHITAVQTQEVGDVDGHTMSVGRYSGLATFPDGSVGTTNFTFSTDYIKGTGMFTTYYNVTFKDGSMDQLFGGKKPLRPNRRAQQPFFLMPR